MIDPPVLRHAIQRTRNFTSRQLVVKPLSLEYHHRWDHTTCSTRTHNHRNLRLVSLRSPVNFFHPLWCYAFKLLRVKWHFRLIHVIDTVWLASETERVECAFKQLEIVLEDFLASTI